MVASTEQSLFSFTTEVSMTVYEAPGRTGSVVEYADRYDHWIGGERVAPAEGGYFENPSPVNGQTFTEVARGIDKSLYFLESHFQRA